MASYSSLNSSGMALEQSSQSINSSGLSLNSAASTIYSPNNTGSPRVGTMVPNRIFVGGIQAGTVEHELRSFFEVYGTVKDVKIIKDPNGTSKGFGFVTYENEEDAKRVQETAASTSDSGLEFKGRRLNVGPAIKKQNPYPPKAFDIFGSGLAPGAVFYTANGIPYTYHNGIALIPTADGGYAAVAQPTPQYAVIPQTIYVPAGNTQQSAYGQTAIMSAAQNQVQTISTAANTTNNCTTAANNNGGGFTITQSAPNQYSVTAAQNGLRYATQMTSAYGPYVYQTSPTYGGGEIMTYAQLAASQGLSNQPEMQEYLAYDMEAMKAACPMAFPPGSIMTVGCMPMASNVLPSNPLIDRPVPSSPGMLNATLDGFNQVFAPMPSYTGIMPKGHRLSVSSDASMASLVPNEPNHVNHKTIGDNKENVSQQTSPKSSGPLKSRVSPVRKSPRAQNYVDRYNMGFADPMGGIRSRNAESSKENFPIPPGAQQAWARDRRMSASLPNSPNQVGSPFMRSQENRRWANSSNNTSAVLSILNQKSPRKSQQLAYTSTSMAPRYSSTPHRGHMKSANGEMVNEGLMGEVVVTPPPTPITHDYQQH